MAPRTGRAENWRAAFISAKTPSNGFWRKPMYARIRLERYMASDDRDFETKSRRRDWVVPDSSAARGRVLCGREHRDSGTGPPGSASFILKDLSGRERDSHPPTRGPEVWAVAREAIVTLMSGSAGSEPRASSTLGDNRMSWPADARRRQGSGAPENIDSRAPVGVALENIDSKKTGQVACEQSVLALRVF
jgi:hypothetical protein